MTQYISKSVVVAEIERRKKCIRMAFSMQGIVHGHDRAYASAQYDAFNSLLSFLDTLEAKEIGLDLGDPKGDKSSEYTVDTKTFEVKDDVVSNDTISNPLEISQNGNPLNGENGDLEEEAKKAGQKYFPDKDNIWARPNYEAMAVANAFKEGTQWQKEQMIEKACSFLRSYQEYQNHDIATDSLIEAFKMYIEL